MWFLLRSPVLSSLILLCVGLGAGSTAAFFSVLDRSILRPFDYDDADALVLLRGANPDRRIVDYPITFREFAAWRGLAESLESLMAYQHGLATLSATELPERVDVAYISPAFFETLSTRPLLGRTPSNGDEAAGAPAVVMISERFWQEHFGRDPTILGREVLLDGRSAAVIGVIPRSFRDPFGLTQDAWVPLGFGRSDENWESSRSLILVGRLRSGMSLRAAAMDMERVAAQTATSIGETGWTVRVFALRERMTASSRPTMLGLSIPVLALLVICWANVATLRLVDSSQRSREYAVRMALGATRLDLLRHALGELAVLVALGLVSGIVLAFWIQHALIALAPASLPGLARLTLDARVVAVGTVCALGALAIAVFGQLIQLMSRPPAETLRTVHGHVAPSRVRRRMLQAMAIFQIGAAVSLVFAVVMSLSTLWVRSPSSTMLDWHEKMTIRLSLRGSRYASGDARTAYVEAARNSLGSIPGVEGVGAASTVPFDRFVLQAAVVPETEEGGDDSQALSVDYAAVHPDFFRVLKIPAVRGRLLMAHDRQGSPVAFVVSESVANTLYPGADALGQRLRATVLNPSGSLRGDVVRVGEVVGIVPDVADPMGANRQRGTIYCAFAQHPMPFVRLVVDAPNVGALERLARERIRDLDPALVPDEVRTLTDMLRLRIDRVQFYAAVTTLFGAVALVLAAVGTYGIVRHLTTQRMREFALRAALGATPSHLRQIVLTHGICLISLGIGVGGIGALVAHRAIAAAVGAVPYGISVGSIGAAAAVTAFVISCAVAEVAWRSHGKALMRVIVEEP